MIIEVLCLVSPNNGFDNTVILFDTDSAIAVRETIDGPNNQSFTSVTTAIGGLRLNIPYADYKARVGCSVDLAP